MTNPITLEYLRNQLRLDPRGAARQIIAARNAQLGLEVATGAAASTTIQSPAAVASARGAIESIRSQFWNLPIESLRSQLAAIDLRPYPELANVVAQLQQAAAVRSEFPKLAQRLNGDLGLFYCVKQSVTMPPRDVAGMKESVMRSLLAGENTKSYKATAQIIKAEFPQIYALQPEWFEDILKAKRLGRDTAARNREFTFGAPNWVFAILFILLLRGCVSLFQ